MRGLFAAALLAVAAIVGACQTTQSVWVRADGHPTTPAEFELDKTVCEGQVAATNVQAGPTYCRGLAGCVVSGVARGLELQQVREGCMASRGYVLRQVPTQAAAPQVAESVAPAEAIATAAIESPASQPAAAPKPASAGTAKERRAVKAPKLTASEEAAVAAANERARAAAAAPVAPPEPQLSDRDQAMNGRN